MQFVVIQVIIAMTLLLQVLVQVNAEFTAQPLPVVQASGLGAEFECYYPGALLHVWRINGVLYDDDQFPADFTRIPPSTSFPEARLIIPATPQYDNTVVQCEALVPIEGGVFAPVQSNNATLTVHDTISLEFETTGLSATVSWDNPFTTNLTFCVDAVSVVSSETLASVCVSGTQYTFTSLDTDLCEEVSFTVTPTDGERNGTSSQPVTEYFQERRDIVFLRCEETQCQAVLTSPLNCEAELTVSTTDGLSPLMSTTTISGNGGTTYTLDFTLEANRHYSVDLTVTTSSGSHYSLPVQTISTHDITEASARPSTIEGALNTSCTFVPNTAARGYMVIISSDSSLDPMFSAQYNTAGTENIIDIVGRGQHSVTFFDLESDGLPVHSRTDPVQIGSAFSVSGVDIPMSSQNIHLTESATRLEKASVERITNNAANIYCSSTVDCLVCLYDPTTPEVLTTLFVTTGEEQRLTLQPENYYSVAFYAIDSSSMSLADRLPERVVNLDPISNLDGTLPPSSDPVTTADRLLIVTSSATWLHGSAFGIIAIMLWLLIVCEGLPDTILKQNIIM